jgi:hypothetical protein
VRSATVDNRKSSQQRMIGEYEEKTYKRGSGGMRQGGNGRVEMR